MSLWCLSLRILPCWGLLLTLILINNSSNLDKYVIAVVVLITHFGNRCQIVCDTNWEQLIPQVQSTQGLGIVSDECDIWNYKLRLLRCLSFAFCFILFLFQYLDHFVHNEARKINFSTFGYHLKQSDVISGHLSE